jgi:glycosyltransferase involved in cell wall biosynthesis
VAFFRLILILRREKVQVVHTHSSKAGILGRWAAWFARVPRILHTVHGWGFHPGQAFPVRWFYQWLERRAAGITDVLITVSRDNRREGLAHGIGREDRYRVIHSGIEPREFVLAAEESAKARRKFKSEKRPCVLVLSNFKPQKSPLDVVRVAGILSVRIPNVLVLWAGDGELRPRVEEDLRGRGLSGNFELLGWRDDVPQLLAAADALLLTSLHEGLPRVVLQAMAAGRPVVATDVSGTPEAVAPGQTGFLHPPHDWEGMADSLHKILTDPKLASEMAKSGREALQGTFLIREMLREIEALYAP